jgi:hypothetical protein
VLWPGPPRAVAELDGLVVGASSRARDAERLAGIVAACVTPRRERLRAVGDDLGLVATSAREQEFIGIDISSPDGVLLAGIASLDERLRRGFRRGCRIRAVLRHAGCFDAARRRPLPIGRPPSYRGVTGA